MSKVLLVGCGHMGSALIMSWLNLKYYSFTIVDPYNFNKLKNNFRNKKIEILNKAPTQKEVKKFEDVVDIAIYECEKYYPSFQQVLFDELEPSKSLLFANFEVLGSA